MTSGGAPPPSPSSKLSNSSLQTSPSPLHANVLNDRIRRSSSHLLVPTQQRAGSRPKSNQDHRKQHKTRRPPLHDEESMAETAAIRSASSRKGQTSITHLMKFTLPPRPAPQNLRYHTHRTHRQAPLQWRVNKARHVQANYRFVADPRSSDYSGSADEPVEWDHVLQVLASAHHQATDCPICLSPPVASRMAKCGHIFCLPCIIRYMHMTSESQNTGDRRRRWSKCPICGELIYMADTRSVRWLQEQVDPPHEGSDVVLRLMIRRPERSLALPRDAADALEEDIPWSHAVEVLDFARVMKGSSRYMAAQFEREVNEVLTREREDEVEYGEGRYWTQKAIGAIGECSERMKEVGDPPDDDKSSWDEHESGRTTSTGRQTALVSLQLDPHGQGSGPILDKSPQMAHTSIVSASSSGTTGPSRRARTRPPTAPPQTPYFFYQLLPSYFLAPLDIRILLAAFGSYSSFPTTILPRIEKVSMGHVVDEELHRRAKYLAHLPLGCEISFLECDMTDIVPAAVLERFAGELEERRMRNLEKQAQEEKERARAEKEEDRKWLTTRQRRESLRRSGNDDGSFSADFATFSDAIDGDADEESPWPSRPTRDGSAFAMLASPSTSPDAQKTVWGTPAVATVSPRVQKDDEVQPASDKEDGWLQGWEAADDKAASSGAKKRKGKKITLMSTNARRGA